MTIKIDKGVPLPLATRGSGYRSPLWDMKPGDSVFFTDRRNAVGNFDPMKKAGWKVSQRKVTENGVTGVRVWRIA